MSSEELAWQPVKSNPFQRSIIMVRKGEETTDTPSLLGELAIPIELIEYSDSEYSYFLNSNIFAKQFVNHDSL